MSLFEACATLANWFVHAEVIIRKFCSPNIVFCLFEGGTLMSLEASLYLTSLSAPIVTGVVIGARNGMTGRIGSWSCENFVVLTVIAPNAANLLRTGGFE